MSDHYDAQGRLLEEPDDEPTRLVPRRGFGRRNRALIAFVSAQLRRPCPHGIPRDQPCRTCLEEIPF